MAMKINPPLFQKACNFERYRQELLAWREVTDLAKSKQGIAIALSLPTDGDCKIREQVFDQLSLADLKKDTGFDTLLTFLDKKLGKDDLEDSLFKFEDFEDYSRKENESINEYIINFDQKYNKILKKNMTLPSEILAFKLLKRANISKEEKMLVLTGMNYTQKEDLFEQAKKSLKKFKSDTLGQTCSPSSSSAIKFEPAFLAANEDALLAAGYVPQQRGGWRNPRTNWRGRKNVRQFSKDMVSRKAQERPMNPIGSDGQPITCIACGSYRHLIKNCPDSWEKLSKVHLVENEDTSASNVVLFTGYNKQEISQLGIEAQNCAVLDSACTSTVCGRLWMRSFLDSLCQSDREKVKSCQGTKVFKFGGGTKLRSLAEYHVPAVIAGKDVMLVTDVVDSDIPLLLSRNAMKKAQVQLDIVNDQAQIFGSNVALNITTSGHYCIPIDREISVDHVFATRLTEMTDIERQKAIWKLHRQFAHPPMKRLVALMKDANVWQDEYNDILLDIQQNCTVCKMYATTPPRPVVAMPMAKKFNERVAMDLKEWNGAWILHLIDMWSRFTVSVFITRKKTSEIIDKIMTHWISIFGVMESIMSDNGGEFNSDEMHEVSSILNINLCTSAANSPFQNGLCERVHAVTDMMLLKLKAEYTDKSEDMLLGWANMAKNSLQMWNGFSSHQLVFGSNPNLPNLMSDSISALHGSTASETLADHLNAMHAARKAFIQTEADERIRRALRSKIRAAEQFFENGEKVFYKREGKEKWLGPGKVVFQDGKVVFVRHGGVFVRVSPNRLIKVNSNCDSVTDSNIMADNTTNDNSACVPLKCAEKESKTFSEQLGKTSETENIENENIAVEGIESENTIIVPSSQPSTKVSVQKNDDIRYKLDGSDEWSEATITGRAGKATGKNKDWYNIQDSNGETRSINLSTTTWEKIIPEEANLVLIPKNQQNNMECLKAKLTELEKLKTFEIYDEIEDEGQFCISTRWLLCRKGEVIRARLVARGFEESVNFQTDSPTIGKCVVRLFLTLAASNNWRIKTTDIKSAFLQGKPLDREVFLLPPEEADSGGKIWKLRKCLYGLNDAARQFYTSVVSEITELGCSQSSLDPSLFYKHNNGQLQGVIVSHIDDFLHAGDEIFDSEIMEPLRKRFLAGKLEQINFTYIGFQLTQSRDGILLNQSNYADNIEAVKVTAERAMQSSDSLTNKEHTLFRSAVGSLNWIVQGSRPDLAFDLIELSMKLKKGDVSDLLRASKVIKKMKAEHSQLYYPNLGPPSAWRLVLFTDAAHANLADGVSSCMAHVVLLVSNDHLCCPVSWKANKIKRVVRSTLAAEALSLQEGLEEALYIKRLMQDLIGEQWVPLPVIAYVDNKSVVEAVHSTKLVDDKRLRIDIGAIRQSLEKKEIHSVRWCPGATQIANCLTKKGASGRQILNIFQTGKINLDV